MMEVPVKRNVCGHIFAPAGCCGSSLTAHPPVPAEWKIALMYLQNAIVFGALFEVTSKERAAAVGTAKFNRNKRWGRIGRTRQSQCGRGPCQTGYRRAHLKLGERTTNSLWYTSHPLRHEHAMALRACARRSNRQTRFPYASLQRGGLGRVPNA